MLARVDVFDPAVLDRSATGSDHNTDDGTLTSRASSIRMMTSAVCGAASLATTDESRIGHE